MNGIDLYQKIADGGFLIFLLVTAWEDLRARRLRPAVLVSGGICGWAARGMLCWLMWKEGLLWRDYLLDGLLALAAGGILLAVCLLTKGGLGAGDGCFFLAAAPWMGQARLWSLLIGGMLLCFLVCGGMIVWGTLKGVSMRKKRLPFIPFLLPAALALLI